MKISRQRQESKYDSVNDLIECFESLQPGNVGHDPSLTQRRLSFIANRVDIEKKHIQMIQNTITTQNINILDIPTEIQSSLPQDTALVSNVTNTNRSSYEEEVRMQIECIIHAVLSSNFDDYELVSDLQI